MPLSQILDVMNIIVRYVPIISLVLTISFLPLWYTFLKEKYTNVVLLTNHIIFAIDIGYIIYALLFASVPMTSIYLVLASFTIVSLLIGRAIVQSAIASIVLIVFTLKYTDLTMLLSDNNIAIAILFTIIVFVLQVLKNTISV